MARAAGGGDSGGMRRMVIAIDGPAGSGKSTVARALAERLGAVHVDTGAYYRAATLAVLRAGVDPADAGQAAAVVAAARITRPDGRTLLDGDDVEAQIRGAAVTAAVSAVAANPAVRAALLDAQRAGVGPDGAVVEGRDAGTVVVPDAGLKVWLDAHPEERGRRRAAQMGADDAAAHARDLARRDAADARQMAQAPDVVTVDTTGLAVAEVVDRLVALLDAVEVGS